MRDFEHKLNFFVQNTVFNGIIGIFGKSLFKLMVEKIN